jgi:N-acetylglutamate synthase-like GNAT family acetyltransferase
MSKPPIVRDARAEDGPRVGAFLTERQAAHNARLGELIDVTRLDTLIAEDNGRLVGLLTWRAGEGELEIHTLHTATPWAGIGTVLLGAVRERARGLGCNRLWLVTTNDNVDALRFYQRRGFRLAKLHPGAVDRSRATLKPAIPLLGDYGIPIRDELELESVLDAPD